MSKQAVEVNFDGLVGPTHNYAGLAYGNVASMKHASAVSNPKAACLEGLEKMKLLMDLGVAQALLPPHERPDMNTLRRLGFRGSDSRVLEQAARKAPDLLASCYSASSMWAANAATVSPSADTADGLVHFTPANLISHFHRAIETEFTQKLLETIFRDPSMFVHHATLPFADQFSDEGAANHTRLCKSHNEKGVELFVYGKKALEYSSPTPQSFPQRQTYEASSAIARLHRLEPQTTVFALQNPVAIDAGVFHNDVISVGNQDVFFYHSTAFSDTPSVLAELNHKFQECCGSELTLIEVRPEQISVREAVDTYLFNSQLVTLPDGGMCFIAPIECMENDKTRTSLESIVADSANPIRAVHYVDIRQSMKNGGGPACLRLRVVLTEDERTASHQEIYLTPSVYGELKNWVLHHYRDRLLPTDLGDLSLLNESRRALDELTQILKLGSIYEFQKV